MACFVNGQAKASPGFSWSGADVPEFGNILNKGDRHVPVGFDSTNGLADILMHLRFTIHEPKENSRIQQVLH